MCSQTMCLSKATNPKYAQRQSEFSSTAGSPSQDCKDVKARSWWRGGLEVWGRQGKRPVVWESAGIRFRGYIFCLPALFLKCLISNLDIIQLFKVN